MSALSLDELCNGPAKAEPCRHQVPWAGFKLSGFISLQTKLLCSQTVFLQVHSHVWDLLYQMWDTTTRAISCAGLTAQGSSGACHAAKSLRASRSECQLIHDLQSQMFCLLHITKDIQPFEFSDAFWYYLAV